MKKLEFAPLLFVITGMLATAAYAASDACCAEPKCFCYKAENGDWKKGTSVAKIPPNAQTKGLQFKDAALGKQPASVAWKPASSPTNPNEPGLDKAVKPCPYGEKPPCGDRTSPIPAQLK